MSDHAESSATAAARTTALRASTDPTTLATLLIRAASAKATFTKATVLKSRPPSHPHPGPHSKSLGTHRTKVFNIPAIPAAAAASTAFDTINKCFEKQREREQEPELLLLQQLQRRKKEEKA